MSVLLIADGTNAVARQATVGQGLTTEQIATRSRNRVLRAARDVKATHVVAAFDAPGETWRYREFPAYKAGGGTGLDLGALCDAAIDLWTDAGIHCEQVEDFEADDTIGTLVKRSSDAGRATFTLSSDNDLFQLLALPRVTVVQYTAAGESHDWLQLRDDRYVLHRFGITPARYVDYLALVGGKNGVPGVKGIGPKTATKYLQEHGDLEGIFDAGLMSGEDLKAALLARRLHTLRTDVPVPALPGALLRVPKAA
jgi:DNA polymerase-1